MEALATSNIGHATAYGDDPWTAAAEQDFAELFDHDVVTFMVWNGTGANVLALGSALSPAGAVVCTDCAHINVDETGAPERLLGSKLMDLPARDGKLTPDQVSSLRHNLGVVHHVQPSVLSITQSTEWGTLYSPPRSPHCAMSLTKWECGCTWTVHESPTPPRPSVVRVRRCAPSRVMPGWTSCPSVARRTG